jgi:hypothetical protein
MQQLRTFSKVLREFLLILIELRCLDVREKLLQLVHHVVGVLVPVVILYLLEILRSRGLGAGHVVGSTRPTFGLGAAVLTFSCPSEFVPFVPFPLPGGGRIEPPLGPNGGLTNTPGPMPSRDDLAELGAARFA